MALLSAVLIQGRIIWWATPWLGYAAAASVLLISAAMLIEHNRANPLLNTRWIGSREIITFAVGAAVMRVPLPEQSFGASGPLSAVCLRQAVPRVGTEWVGPWRSGWSQYMYNKKGR